jgi:hypothetical protein
MSAALPDFFGLAEAGAHVGFGGHAFLKFGDALRVAAHQAQDK